MFVVRFLACVSFLFGSSLFIPDRIVAQDIDDFAATWVNVNSNTSGITRIVLEPEGKKLTVHAFGRCSPSDCDWGEVSTPFEGSPVVAVYRFEFKTTTLTLCLASLDLLYVHSDNIFHDGTGRDYVVDNLFRREESPPDGLAALEEFVDTWVNVLPDPEDRSGLPTHHVMEVVIERAGDDLRVRVSGQCRPEACNEEWGTQVVGLVGNSFTAVLDFGRGPRSFIFELVGGEILRADGGRRSESVLRRQSAGDTCSGAGGEPPRTRFIRADSDSGGSSNITDAVYTINYLFVGGPGPTCLDAADADDDGAVNLTDSIYLLNHLFLGGPSPGDPVGACGTDPTDDALTCQSFPPCAR